ncbi:MAG: transposase domain-containing protein [Kofleriaceae bacterium]
MFYGSDTHAEAAAALFSLLASCRLHGIEPFAYLDEVLRVLPYWPRERYLELAPAHWRATRARLNQDELDQPIASFEVPPAIRRLPRRPDRRAPTAWPGAALRGVHTSLTPRRLRAPRRPTHARRVQAPARLSGSSAATPARHARRPP